MTDTALTGPGTESSRDWFDELVTWLTGRLVGDEVLLANVDGERSDFIRFNHGDVRQAGSVRQTTVHLDLIEGARHAQGSIEMSLDPDQDRPRLGSLLDGLREQRRIVPTDPYLLFNTEVQSSDHSGSAHLLDPSEALQAVRAAGSGSDLVGIYAAGDMFTGFANSLGQRNWFATSTFNLDWSFYLRADKAAKNMYAGFDWDDAVFARKVDWSRRQLEVLERDPMELAPGGYRTYLAPAAVQELVDLLSWDGFGLRAHRTRQTPLLRMITEHARLATEVSLSEHTAGGVAPNFSDAGFTRPDEVVLIDHGAYRDTLVSPRSAQEFGETTNGASAWEVPESLSMTPGSIPVDDTAERLGTGLYVGNLWYSNFSDRAACRATGMTRFATFWAQDGEIVAPVNVLRFDDTAYHLLGDRLEGLTDEAELVLDASTYERRSTSSFRLPGALISEMTFTL